MTNLVRFVCAEERQQACSDLRHVISSSLLPRLVYYWGGKACKHIIQLALHCNAIFQLMSLQFHVRHCRGCTHRTRCLSCHWHALLHIPDKKHRTNIIQNQRDQTFKIEQIFSRNLCRNPNKNSLKTLAPPNTILH